MRFFPPYFHYPFYKNYNNSGYIPKNNIKTNVEPKKETISYIPAKSENKENKEDDTFFEFFGIKLYFDDILIICLIFFLYNEEVKDPSLFISLILLLLN